MSNIVNGPVDIEKLMALHDRATKGNWVCTPDMRIGRSRFTMDIVVEQKEAVAHLVGEGIERPDDALFIAEVKNSFPSILAELIGLREIVKQLEHRDNSAPYTPFCASIGCPKRCSRSHK